MPSSKSVNATPVKAVTGARSQDGNRGVLFLIRDQPGANGQQPLIVSVTTELLPAVAAVCLGLMDPRRSGQGGRKSRALTATKQIEVGVADNGQVALTFRLESNASISFGLNASQARDLAEALVEFEGLLRQQRRPALPQLMVTPT